MLKVFIRKFLLNRHKDIETETIFEYIRTEINILRQLIQNKEVFKMEVKEIIQLQKDITGLKQNIQQVRRENMKNWHNLNFIEARHSYIETMIEGLDD